MTPLYILKEFKPQITTPDGSANLDGIANFMGKNMQAATESFTPPEMVNVMLEYPTRFGNIDYVVGTTLSPSPLVLSNLHPVFDTFIHKDAVVELTILEHLISPDITLAADEQIVEGQLSWAGTAKLAQATPGEITRSDYTTLKIHTMTLNWITMIKSYRALGSDGTLGSAVVYWDFDKENQTFKVRRNNETTIVDMYTTDKTILG